MINIVCVFRGHRWKFYKEFATVRKVMADIGNGVMMEKELVKSTRILQCVRCSKREYSQ